MDLLNGKVAIITGASKGIGRVMSRLFRAGGRGPLSAPPRSGALVEETAALVNKTAAPRDRPPPRTPRRKADVKRIVAEGVRAFGKIDTLVNNAGDGGPTKPVQDTRKRTGSTPSTRVSPAPTCASGSRCPR